MITTITQFEFIRMEDYKNKVSNANTITLQY